MSKLISLCMIVKNESAVLKRCLDSIKTLVDEMIIIDTGSTDNTKTIASKFTNNVHDLEWENDFSKARNESIHHATGNWILILDADEYMLPENHESLRQFLKSFNQADNEVCAFLLPIHNFTGKTADPTKVKISTGARLYPNHKGIHYRSQIHEQLTIESAQLKFIEIPFSIYHDGYTEARVNSQDKKSRNQNIFESMLTNENLEDPYFCFTYGNHFISTENLDRGLEFFRKSYKHSNSTDPWYFHLLDNLISTEIKLLHFSEASLLIKIALEQWPKIADYYFFRGLLKEQLGFLKQASSDFEYSMQLAESAALRGEKCWKINPSYGDTLPLQMLGNINAKLQNHTAALQYWSKLLKLQPKNYQVLSQVVQLLSRNESQEEIARYFEIVYPSATTMEHATLFLVSLRSGNQELSNYYYHKIPESISIDEKLSYQLLQHYELPSQVAPSIQLDSSLAIAAALIYENPEYLSLIGPDYRDASVALVDSWKAAIADSSYRPNLSQNESRLLSEVLLLFYRYKYKDFYYFGLQQLADLHAINRLADMLYETNYTEEALNIYSLLLDNDALLETGLLYIGQWYLANNASVEGLPFLEACINQSFRHELIGWVFNYGDTNCYQVFRSAYLSSNPQMEQALAYLASS